MNMMDDIYGDLDNFDVGQSITELEVKNKALTEQIEQLTKSLETVNIDLEEVKKINKQLQENISKLFNTAKTELDRKAQIIADLRKQLDDLLFKRNVVSNYKIPKKRKLTENVGVNKEDVTVKKIKLDEVKKPEKENTETKPTPDNRTDNRKTQNNRDNKRNGRFQNRRSRDRSLARRRNRSRTRSRERNRRSPPRERHRQRRDSWNNRRNRSREASRERRPPSPDDTRDKRHRSPDSDQRILEPDRKSYLDTFKKREMEKHSDSESVISVKSNSSVDDVLIVKESKLKVRTESLETKATENVAKPEIVNINYVDSEPEEGEISDDGSEIVAVEIKKNEEVIEKDKKDSKEQTTGENKECKTEKEKENVDSNKRHDKNEILDSKKLDKEDKNVISKKSEKDNIEITKNNDKENELKNKYEKNKKVNRTVEKQNTVQANGFSVNGNLEKTAKQSASEKITENKELEKKDKQKHKPKDLPKKEVVSKKPDDKTTKKEETNKIKQEKSTNKEIKPVDSKTKTKLKEKHEFLFGADSVDFEATLMGHKGLTELEEIQKYLENELKSESDSVHKINLEASTSKIEKTEKIEIQQSLHDILLAKSSTPKKQNINETKSNDNKPKPQNIRRSPRKAVIDSKELNRSENTNKVEITEASKIEQLTSTQNQVSIHPEIDTNNICTESSSTPLSTNIPVQNVVVSTPNPSKTLPKMELSQNMSSIANSSLNVTDTSTNSLTNVSKSDTSVVATTNTNNGKPEISNLPQKKVVRRRRCILTIQ